MRRLYWRIVHRGNLWRQKHRNAMCNRCGYPTRQSWWRQFIGWTACPSCWEEGGTLVRFTKSGVSGPTSPDTKEANHD